MYQYKLEPYQGMNSRYTCPGCGKHKIFTRYINAETGQHFAEHVGKCNREINCSYHFTPKQYFETNKPLFGNLIKPEFSYIVKKEPPKPKPVSFIPVEHLKRSLGNHSGNNFVKYLIDLFGAELAGEAVSRYFIGTSEHWIGATIFWQIDALGNVRTGKIMLYDANTGKRVKEPFNHITWVHSVLKKPEFALKQCLFGEHLLQTELNKPVAIVESEKTAVIASLYLPQFLWLACGSLTNLTVERCQVLQGRNVTLFPDLNAFEKWNKKAQGLSQFAPFVISDLLENKATEAEREGSLDLADYLVRLPFNEFQSKPPIELINSDEIKTLLGQTHTGKDFEYLIIVGIKTHSHKIYDLIFNSEGEPVRPGEQAQAVNRLETFFEKPLLPALFDNKPCLVHIVK
jgi:hypothetical protein